MSRIESPRRSASIGILTGLALLSGSCALAYEILYMRALTTLLGDMLYVHAALLSTFLVGIALGAKLAQNRSRRTSLGAGVTSCGERGSAGLASE